MATATWSVETDLDTFLYNQLPTANYGDATNFNATILLFGGAKTVWQRGLLNFPLAGFPDIVANITTAMLTLDISALQNPTELIDFRRCTRPTTVVELEATWEKYRTADNWTIFGGDSTEDDKVTTEIGSAHGVREIPGFAALAIDALTEVARENILSLLMRLQDETTAGSSRTFQVHSREAVGHVVPKLTITYTVPDTAVTAQESGHRDTIPPGNARQPRRPLAPRQPRSGRRVRLPRS